jgi:hypothetical protein
LVMVEANLGQGSDLSLFGIPKGGYSLRLVQALSNSWKLVVLDMQYMYCSIQALQPALRSLQVSWETFAGCSSSPFHMWCCILPHCTWVATASCATRCLHLFCVLISWAACELQPVGYLGCTCSLQQLCIGTSEHTRGVCLPPHISHTHAINIIDGVDAMA